MIPKTILTTNFGAGGTPGLNGWTYAGATDTPVFIKDPSFGWCLALAADPTGGEVAWIDLNSLEAGIYEVSALTRAVPGPGNVLPNGKILLGHSKEVLCGPDTFWHSIALLDTITSGSTAIHLYGGLSMGSGSRTLFNEVNLVKLP